MPFTQQQIDAALDAVLKAGGSALRHYTMPRTLADMRAAMVAALQQAYDLGANHTAGDVAGHNRPIGQGE